MATTESPTDSTPSPSTPAPTLLQRFRMPLMILGPVVVVCLALYFYLTGGRHESTNDAYVQAARVAISSNVGGPGRRSGRARQSAGAPGRSAVSPGRRAVPHRRARSRGAARRGDACRWTRSRRTTVSAALRPRRHARRYAFQQSELARQRKLLSLRHRLAGAGRSGGPRAGRRARRPGHRPAGDRRGAGTTRRRCEHRARAASGRAAGAGRARSRATRSFLYDSVHAPGDGVVTRVEQLQVGNYVAAHDPGVRARVHGRRLDRGEFQGRPARPHATPGRRRASRSTAIRARRFAGSVASVSPGHRLAVLAAAGGKRHRQLGEGRAAIAGAHRAAARPTATYPLHVGLSATVKVDTR